MIITLSISDGRMQTMRLPKTSTVKPPKFKVSKEEPGYCENILKQQFNQPSD